MSKVTAATTIALAKSQVGYTGKKSNKDLDDFTANTVGKYTKYARDVAAAGFYNSSKQNQPWCCTFVDWLFLNQTGSLEGTEVYKPVSIYGAGVGWAYGAYNNAGMAVTDPAPGDQVFYYSGKPGDFTHTGFVVAVDDNNIYTVEGNWGNRVAERVLAKNDKSIYGYGRPRYDSDEPAPEPPDPTPVKPGDVGRVKSGAHVYNAMGEDLGYTFSNWVYSADVIVGEVRNGVAHFSTDFTLKAYTGWTALENIIVTLPAPGPEPDPEPEPEPVNDDLARASKLLAEAEEMSKNLSSMIGEAIAIINAAQGK